MHFRFRMGGHHGSHWANGRGPRWAAFARAFSEDMGNGSHNGWGFGGPSGPRRRFGAEALKYLLLHLIGEEPRHGYDLIKAIEGLSGGLYAPSPGMVYPTLTLLADQGLIEELAGEERSRRYAITEAGRQALADARHSVVEALERLAEMAGAVRDDDTQPLRRAFRNLKSAAGERMAAGNASRETALAIAAILDEAAQKIERL